MHLEKRNSILIDTTKPIFLLVKNQLFEGFKVFRRVYVYGDIVEAAGYIAPEFMMRHAVWWMVQFQQVGGGSLVVVVTFSNISCLCIPSWFRLHVASEVPQMVVFFFGKTLFSVISD